MLPSLAPPPPATSWPPGPRRRRGHRHDSRRPTGPPSRPPPSAALADALRHPPTRRRHLHQRLHRGEPGPRSSAAASLALTPGRSLRASIGPVTSGAMRALGLEPHHRSRPAPPSPALVDALASSAFATLPPHRANPNRMKILPVAAKQTNKLQVLDSRMLGSKCH